MTAPLPLIPEVAPPPPEIVTAHTQKTTHSYLIHFPDHAPREQDPYYADFHHFKANRRKAGTYTCDFAVEHRGGNTSECDLTKPLEAHHRIIEFAVMNSVDLSLLEHDYPGISLMTIGKWTESATNLMLLCVPHHRGHMGVHVASASDYAATFYIRNLIS
jgi:hypothetical protein